MSVLDRVAGKCWRVNPNYLVRNSDISLQNSDKLLQQYTLKLIYEFYYNLSLL